MTRYGFEESDEFGYVLKLAIKTYVNTQHNNLVSDQDFSDDLSDISNPDFQDNNTPYQHYLSAYLALLEKYGLIDDDCDDSDPELEANDALYVYHGPFNVESFKHHFSLHLANAFNLLAEPHKNTDLLPDDKASDEDDEQEGYPITSIYPSAPKTSHKQFTPRFGFSQDGAKKTDVKTAWPSHDEYKKKNITGKMRGLSNPL